MVFDEYEYLEKAVEDPGIRREHRHHRDRDGDADGGESSKRSGVKDEDGIRDGRDDRSERREKDSQRSSRDGEKERDRVREHRSRERNHRDRERERERERRSSSRSRRHERSRSRERERERERRSSSRYREDREFERSRSREERERERERRSSSRYREDRELERSRSRERTRKRELERELREREMRRSKERKESMEPEADPERDQRTVFAYQMPLKATERDVYEFFSQVGKVRDVRLIMDRNSRRSKGVGLSLVIASVTQQQQQAVISQLFAYIEFYDVMAVPRAIALSGQLLLGQPVMVKPSEAEKNLVQSTTTGTGAAGGATERKLYVGNLHFNMTEEQLRQIFEPFGPVELVQLPLDQDTGHCRGYGFVQFAQLEHAKAAAQGLNGKLEIAGRIIKVSAVADHVRLQDSGNNAADFDDEDGGGLSLDAQSRAMLMLKLDRTGTATSIAESLGLPIVNGAAANQQAFILPINGHAMMPSALAAQRASSTEPIVQPSECLLLKNMFDPSTETEPDFDAEIKDAVQEECSKFGHVKHIYVDKNSMGWVFLRFDSVAAAINCQRAMHGRWFAARAISATFMRPQEYEAKFGLGA